MFKTTNQMNDRTPSKTKFPQEDMPVASPPSKEFDKVQDSTSDFLNNFEGSPVVEVLC